MEELIVSLCTLHGRLKDSELTALISQNRVCNEVEKVEAINNLLEKGKLSLSLIGKDNKQEVVYSILSETQALSMKNLDGSDALILQIVREAGDKGI